METLRIAHVIGDFAPTGGGQARMVANLAAALEARGHVVPIFAIGRHAGPNGNGARHFGVRDVLRGRLCKELRAESLDVIHCHGYSSLVPAATLPAEFALPAARVLTPHYHEGGSFSPAARVAYRRTLGSLVCRAAHQIQVDTPFEAKALGALHRIPPEAFAVVPPSLAPSIARAPVPSDRRRPTPFTVLFVGRVAPYKGVDVLIRSVGQLRSRGGPPVGLTIVGRSVEGYTETLRAVAREAGVDDLDLRGPVSDEDLVALYDRCGALALPSRFEAFGIVLLEAMSRGLPVIASDAGGIPFLVTNEKEGLLSPYGDVDRLAASLSRLAQDDLLWRRLSVAARQASEQYTVDKVAEIALAAYRGAIARRAAN